jgi:hypothetical protein
MYDRNCDWHSYQKEIPPEEVAKMMTYGTPFHKWLDEAMVAFNEQLNLPLWMARNSEFRDAVAKAVTAYMDAAKRSE